MEIAQKDERIQVMSSLLQFVKQTSDSQEIQSKLKLLDFPDQKWSGSVGDIFHIQPPEGLDSDAEKSKQTIKELEIVG